MTSATNWRSLFVALTLLALPTCILPTPQSPSQPSASPKSSTQDSLESHLGKGYEALKQEQYDRAEKEFRAALAIDSTLVMRAQFPLAVSLFEQHKFTESRHEFESVRQSDGDKPGVLYYLGRIDLEEHNYTQAIAFLTKAAAHPPFPDTAFYLGMAYLKQGSNDAAEKWLKKAIELNPKDSRAAYQLATLYRKEGREDEANQAFQQSKQQRSQSDKLSQLRFECNDALDHGPPDKASAVCDQLDDPNDAEKLTALGVLYGQHGQKEKALPPLQRAAELSPESPQIQYNLAYTYFQLNRFAEARAALESPVQRWPDLFPLISLYGIVLGNLGDIPGAYQALHQAYQLNAQDPSTIAALYQAALQMAQRSEDAHADLDALRFLQEAASLVPASPEPHQRLASIYKRTGKPDLAASEEQKAAQLASPSRN